MYACVCVRVCVCVWFCAHLYLLVDNEWCLQLSALLPAYAGYVCVSVWVCVCARRYLLLDNEWCLH